MCKAQIQCDESFQKGQFDFHFLPGFCKTLANVSLVTPMHHPSSKRDTTHPFLPGVPERWVFCGIPGSEDLCDWNYSQLGASL